MADRPLSPAQPAAFNSGSNANTSDPSLLRKRSLGRSATFAETMSKQQPSNLRRSSTLSDSVSEARHSIRSSTDDLLFPTAHKDRTVETHHEESHWHSAPLALALLPAVGGIFFKNGSAVITDITLLVLAAIFLNWSARLPWGWYRSAQAIRLQDAEFLNDTIMEESQAEGQEAEDELKDGEKHTTTSTTKPHTRHDLAAHAAARELIIHELAALLSCFVFPLIGAWLLHAIRDKLSRPSEGLVSNYNLTIFLLAAEIRPFAHPLRMVQARTLHLQRIVAASPFGDDRFDDAKFLDVVKRLEELEVHIADSAAAKLDPNSSKIGSPTNEQQEPQLSQGVVVAQVTGDVRKGFQPELDALNRAVRRYEKRTTLMAFQTDSRLHELETQVRDSLALAAAAERSTATQRESFAFVLLDWICATVVVPARMLLSLVSLPARIAAWCLQNLKLLFGIKQKRGKGTINSRGKQPIHRGGTAFDRPMRRTAPVSQSWAGKSSGSKLDPKK